MNMGKWLGFFWIVSVSLIFICGTVTGDIPPISVQNAHTSITADFVADILTGSVPCTISFTDTSSGVIDNREWSFGDGESSYEQNPVHVYTIPGVYTVSLSVTGTGGTDKKTRIGYLKINESDKEKAIILENTSSEQILNTTIPDVIQNGEMEIAKPSLQPTQEPKTESTEQIQIEKSPAVTIDSSDILNPPPTIQAEFSVEESLGLAPLEVVCSDSSIGNIRKWHWDFGDGTTSAAQSPIHIYQNPGIYSITLTVEGDDGSDSITKTDLVHVIEPASAAFSAQVTEGVVPLEVQFEEQSSGLIVKRDWSFGDGSTSDTENPVHVYKNPGVYEVSLTVYGSHNEDKKTRPSYIIVKPDLPTPTPTVPPTSVPTPIPLPSPVPTPEIQDTPEPLSNSDSEPEISPIIVDYSVTPTEGTAPLSVIGKDLSTGEISRWLWQFGDGNISTGQNCKYKYEVPGDYLLNLTIYGTGVENGISKEQLVHVSAPFLPPIAEFTVSSTEGTTPFSMVCTDQSTGEISDWIWNFGDGKIIRGKNPTHTYYEPGVFSITLTVKGPGGKDELTKESLITVHSPEIPLQASFTGNNSEGTAPLNVSFSDSSRGTVTGWAWEFGDGETSVEQNPSHVYTNPGIYSVTLVVTGPGGDSKVARKDLVNVKEVQIPVQAAFSALPVNGEAPLLVSFTDKSVGNVSSWTWEFGDGDSSDQQNPEHTYTKPGIYSVSMEAKGEGGPDKSTRTDLISVHGSSVTPELLIKADPAEGVAPLSVSFSKSPIGNERSNLWDFGDGNTSPEASPAHTYVTPGLYNVSLSILDMNGNNRTITKNQFVNVTKPIPPPVAKFATNTSEGVVPCTVRFTDMSEGEITEWNWEFEPGKEKTTQDAVYTYTIPGTYSIRLTVKGPGGSDNVEKELILIQQPLEQYPGEIQAPKDIIPNISGKPEIANDTDEKTDLSPKIEEISVISLPESDLISVPEENQTISRADNESPISESLQIDDKLIKPTPVSTQDISHGKNITQYENGLSINPTIYSSETEGYAPLTVQFNSSWTQNGSYLWKFGDGTSAQEKEPEHTYGKPGVYTVHLIFETENETREIIENNYIQVSDPASIPSASFSAEPLSGEAPLNVTFMSTSKGSITNYDWKFGDKTLGDGEKIVHRYTKPGIYSVELRVTGPGGSSNVTNKNQITVLAAKNPPQAEFRSDKRTGNAPLQVNFTDQSVGEVSKTLWKFGDGTESDDLKPSHIYNNTGIFTVTLEVEGPDGIDSVTRKGYIVVNSEPEPLIARFNVTPASGDAPLTIHCNDTSSGVIKRYLWEFGDGAVSEIKNPTHRYIVPGSYLLTLTVYGNSEMSSADQVILVGPVLSKISGNIGRIIVPDKQ